MNYCAKTHWSRLKKDFGMIKLVALLKRKNGITLEEFSQHWHHEHAPLVLKTLPEIRRYIQNHAVRVPGGEQKFDGVAEVWFDDIQSWRQSFLGDRGKPILDDEEKFLNRTESIFMVAEERVIKP